MEHFAEDNDHVNYEFESIIMVVDMAFAASRPYLCLRILTNNEECQFTCFTTCLGQTCTCVMIMCI